MAKSAPSAEELSGDEIFYSATEGDEDEVVSLDEEGHQCCFPSEEENEIAAAEELQLPTITDTTIDHICALTGLAKDDLAQRLAARRFAVANGGDVNKACRQFRERQQWVTRMRTKFASVPLQSNPLLRRVGWDRLGHPLLVYNGPALNTAFRTGDEAIRFACAAMEDTFQSLEAHAHPPRMHVQKMCLMLYLPRGAEPDLRKLAPLLKAVQRYYPERVYRLLIFPVGHLTPFFWNVVKNIVEARTARKIVFLEGGSAPPGLAEFVAPDQLPRDFGGLGEVCGWCTPPETPRIAQH